MSGTIREDNHPKGSRELGRTALFIPCYIDQLYPQVGIATVALLERLGVTLEYPREQTCCGQPMLNAGFVAEARPVAVKFAQLFESYDYVVCPSGSCTSMVRNHYHELLEGHFHGRSLDGRVFELCEFIHDVLGVRDVGARFPHRVGLHHGCHGLRELRLARSTERMDPEHDKVRALLEHVDRIELVEIKRPQECCGFGGLFAVAEEAVSVRMGLDRIADHEQAGAEYITSADMSCLMHMEGLITREKKPMKVLHIAELLNSGAAQA